jgi:hypothetical protein
MFPPCLRTLVCPPAKVHLFYKVDWRRKMADTEMHEFMSTVLEHAQSGKHIEFHFLRSLSEYKFYKRKCRSFKFLIKILQKGADRLYKNYCISIEAGTSNFTKLLAYQQMLHVIDFYKEDVATMTEMLYEYDAYLLEGNYIFALIGELRPEEDLVDFRGRY